MRDVETILHSKIYEERLIAFMIIISKFEKSDQDVQKEIFDFYLANTKYINYWDLVEFSASRIVGDNFKIRERSVLYRLATSSSHWERRISIISTLYIIVLLHESKDTFALSNIILHD